MARQFDGATQSLQSSAPLDLSAAFDLLTLSFWLWWNGFANDDQLALEYSANFNTNAGAFIVDPNSDLGAFGFANSFGDGGQYRYALFPRPSAAAWHHYLLVLSVTGVVNMAAYVDGVAQTLTSHIDTGGQGWGNFTLNVMSRNNASLWAAGRMTGLGIWTSGLSAANAVTLAGGAAPSTVATPAYAWNICGIASPEPASAGTPTLTVTGATLGAGPGSFRGCAAAAGPVFSDRITLGDEGGGLR